MNSLARVVLGNLKSVSRTSMFVSQSRMGFSSLDRLKKLRDETGSPIAQVKKALDEFGGDFEKAKEYLIQKGLASAQKMLNKDTREGVVALHINENRSFAVLGEMNCETDFVARSDLFLEFVHTALKTIVIDGKPINLDENQQEAIIAYLSSHTLCNEIIKETATDSIDKVRQLVISKLQENINIRRINTLSIENGIIGSYVHNTLAKNVGSRACLVSLAGAKNTESANALADNIALQILGMRPEYMTRAHIPATTLEAEIEKIKADFGTSLNGKPAAVVERMIEGKLKKFYEDTVLLDQPFLAD